MMKKIVDTPLWEIALLILTYVIPIGFYCYSLALNESHWFSCSGSLMVIFGAFLEYRNFGIQQYLREKRDETWKADPGVVAKLKLRKLFDIFILGSLILGTVIWGYGDLLF